MSVEGLDSQAEPGPNQQISDLNTKSLDSSLTGKHGLVEPLQVNVLTDLDETTSHFETQIRLPHKNGIPVITADEGNLAFLEDSSYSNESIESQNLHTAQSLERPSREISNGVDFEVDLDVLEAIWEPFDGNIDVENDMDLNNGYPEISWVDSELSWDEWDLDSSNIISPRQAQQCRESGLPPLAPLTHTTGNTSKILTNQTSISAVEESSGEFKKSSASEKEHSDMFQEAPQLHDHRGLLMQEIGDSELLIRPLLSSMKQELVDGIMKEFWTTFKQEWSTNVQKHSEKDPRSLFSTSQKNFEFRKRRSSKVQKRERKDTSEKSEDYNERDAKRFRVDPTLPKDSDEKRKFSCPYRKHDPQKHCYQSRHWRSCALTSFDSVAHVKGHLYRHHRIFQCPRCKILHKNSDELERHILAVNACEVIHQQPIEGITWSIERKLKGRKRQHQEETEVERWQEIYETLFPEEIVPLPYFEPMKEEITRCLESGELVSYGEHTYQDLPPVFQSALEAAISIEANLVEQRLKSQLTAMIQVCQTRDFPSYEARGSTDGYSQDDLCVSLGSPQSFKLDDNQDEMVEIGSGNSKESVMATQYQQQASHSSHQAPSQTMLADMTAMVVEEIASSDSGYSSEPSTLISEHSSSEEKVVSKATTLDNSQHQDVLESLQFSHDSQGAKAELNNHQSMALQISCTQQSDMHEYPNLSSVDFSMDSVYSYAEDFGEFDLEKWMPVHGGEVGQETVWREWGISQC